MSYGVLLVDDEPNVVSALKRALHKEGFRIFTANSGLEGLDVLRSRVIDVVISDQDMPGMKGTEFLSAGRSEFPDTVRFILTGKATLEVAMSAINSGEIFRFFTKPCSHIEVAAAIRQAMEQKEVLTETKRLLRVLTRQNALLELIEQEEPGITQVGLGASMAARNREMPSEWPELKAEIEAQIRRSEQIVSPGTEEGPRTGGPAPA
ncbi:MAG: response regulator [Planctomycetota bacterium]